jgi:serine/threonine-protein kinase RsbW
MSRASTQAPDSDRLSVLSEGSSIDAAETAIVTAAERHQYSKASIFAVRLAVHEALMNGFKHGHKGMPASLPVVLSYKVKDRTIEVSVEDQGPGFTPEEVPDPTLEENIERGSGRGLLLIRAYMSRVEYNAKGNRITMVYEKPE